MQFGADGTEKKGVLTLEGPMTVQRAADVKSFLLSALENVDEVAIDVGKVTEVDVCGLQLFCSAQRTASQRHKRLAIAGSLPEVFRKAADEAGRCFQSRCVATDQIHCPWRGVSG